jgi:uncharacterized membrane protein
MSGIAGFTLLQPVSLVLLLLVPLFWRLARARMRNVPIGQRHATFWVRSALAISLVLALTEPVLSTRNPSLQVTFLVDRSKSISTGQTDWINEWLSRAQSALQPEDRASVLEFGRQASSPGVLQSDPANLDTTNVERALRTGAALLPSDGNRNLVLLSDGWETAGHTLQSDVLTDGTSVSYVPPPSQASTDASIRTIDVPSHSRVGDPLDITVTVDSVTELTATLHIWLDDKTVSEQEIDLNAGTNRLSLAPTIRNTGFHTVRAEIVNESDARVENNGAAADFVTKEAGRVLVIEERAGEGAGMADYLASTGVNVDTASVGTIPAEPTPLRPYDSIVLANVPATAMTLDQLRTIQLYVREMGRGLIVTGGARSYGPGGYEGTILDEMLPVSSTPPSRRLQGSVALMLVIDRSGSMDLFHSDASKIAMAREAAIQATDQLRADDILGVIGFDSRFQWVVPLSRLHTPDDNQRAQAAISTIRADGGTNIFPALEAAFEAMKNADARLKHIVLLTDGQSYNSDYAGLIQRMRPYDITLSTVAVGSDSDTKLLNSLANQGDGRYYFTERSAEIPKIASKEANILTRNATIEGDVSVLTGEASPIMRGVNPDLPQLSGYIGTTPRPTAVTALDTDRGDPLLAHWQYGLGRVVSWTSDTKNLWAGQWLGSSAAEQVWAQAIRWSMPEPQPPEFRVSAGVDGQTVTLRAVSVHDDGRFADLLDTRATVVTPGGDAVEARLPQRAPGLYELSTEAPGPGVYRVVFNQYEDGKMMHEEMAGFVINPAPESRAIGVNNPLLDQLASRTNGRALGDPSDVAGLSRASIRKDIPLWPWLVGLALILLPLDVAIRRLRWPWFSPLK